MENYNNKTSDYIREMLEDPTDKTPPRELSSGGLAMRPFLFTLIIGIFLVIASLLLIHTTMLYFITVFGLGVAFVGGSVIIMMVLAQHEANAMSYDNNRRGHFEIQEQTRLAQRGVALNALKDLEVARMNNHSAIEVARLQSPATVEAAKYQALGMAGDKEFQKGLLKLQESMKHDEAAREREWRSSEAEKDRQSTIEQMITRFEGKIREIEVRMEYEKPSAATKSQEELILLKGRVTQLREVNKIKDERLRKQMFDQIKNTWKSA